MIYIREIETTAGKEIIYECDCEEYRGSSAASCKHTREEYNKRENEKLWQKTEIG